MASRRARQAGGRRPQSTKSRNFHCLFFEALPAQLISARSVGTQRRRRRRRSEEDEQDEEDEEEEEEEEADEEEEEGKLLNLLMPSAQ